MTKILTKNVRTRIIFLKWDFLENFFLNLPAQIPHRKRLEHISWVLDSCCSRSSLRWWLSNCLSRWHSIYFERSLAWIRMWVWHRVYVSFDWSVIYHSKSVFGAYFPGLFVQPGLTSCTQHLRFYISFGGIGLLSIWLNKPRQLLLLFSPGVANILPQCAIFYEPSLNHVTPRNLHLRPQFIMTKWQFLAALAALYLHIWDSLINS